MLKYSLLLLTIQAVLFVSCSTTKPAASKSPSAEDTAYVELDTMVITDDGAVAEIGFPYQPSVERHWDLLHTMLDLSFDWNTRSVTGKATLTLTPLFYSQSELKLNAVDFTIRKILIGDKAISNFKYDSNVITIPLDQPMARRDKLTLSIEYTASPKEGVSDNQAGITSDQGLYFIDPLDTLPEVARQIWTQGETSSNRRWYPTLDQPNERATQEIFLTVADTFMTLSNGTLISSTTLPGGLRRDHWKLELPIAPYLTMIAVGKWDKVTDYWRGRPVEYYVNPGYEKDARAIFAHTPEMIEFFSQKLDVDFVWPKYAQVIVKDFVSGAMENASAVVFGDFIQFHEGDVLSSAPNDYIVAHELVHHWFGDLVTCESWAHLVLNEGFANYGEYLWFEHKYGRERADVSRMSELSGYFDQTEYDVHPLTYYNYPSERSIFDAHSYNKGGLILHMLRDFVGDEAFYASLRLYLQRHAYSSVETDDLRQAFEEVTGKDLNWFFDQWFFEKGHPILEVSHYYNDESKQVILEIDQTQDQLGHAKKFRLPIEIGLYDEEGKSDIHKIWLEEETQTFTFDVKGKPTAVVFDPRDILLAVVNQEIPESEYLTRLLHTPSISHRISALTKMTEIPDDALEAIMMDSSYTMRGMAVQYLTDHFDVVPLNAMALKEKNPEVQYLILESLKNLSPEMAKDYALQLLESTDKNPIIRLALTAIAEVDIDEALKQSTRYDQNNSPSIYAARAELYAKKGKGTSLDFFKDEKAKQLPLEYLEEFIFALTSYLSFQSEPVIDEGFALINSDFYLKGPTQEYRRFYLMIGLIRQYSELPEGPYQTRILESIKSHYNKETDEYLREALKEGLGDLLD